MTSPDRKPTIVIAPEESFAAAIHEIDRVYDTLKTPYQRLFSVNFMLNIMAGSIGDIYEIGRLELHDLLHSSVQVSGSTHAKLPPPLDLQGLGPRLGVVMDTMMDMKSPDRRAESVIHWVRRMKKSGDIEDWLTVHEFADQLRDEVRQMKKE